MIEATRTLRIAMLAPISWPVPPKGYGPWEKVAWSLTEELVHKQHEVTLFAAAGSRTSAQLVETVPHPLSVWPEDELRMPQQLDPQSGLLVGRRTFGPWNSYTSPHAWRRSAGEALMLCIHTCTCMRWSFRG